MSDRPWAGRTLHLVGLGGAGMSGYARVATALGARVSGSDRAGSPALAALREPGVEAHVGDDAATAPPGDGVEVYHSTAIPPANPERAAAHEGGIPDRPRAELLQEISRLKQTLPVHGARRRARKGADDVDGRARPAAVRDGAGVPHGRRAAHDRAQRRLGRRRLA